MHASHPFRSRPRAALPPLAWLAAIPVLAQETPRLSQARTMQEAGHALRAAMADASFINLPEEWWHFRLDPEPTPGSYCDVPVTASGLPAPSARDRARVDPAIRP